MEVIMTLFSSFSRRSILAAALAAGLLPGVGANAADKPSEIRIDWATYNPVSMVLKDKGLLEQEFAKDGIKVRWVHPDGKTALIRGDVDAWAGLDPMMAQAEVEDGARLFYRNAEANTWGILNVRQEFLKDHPDLVQRVLAVYEEARKYSLANPAEVKRVFVAATKLPDAVVEKQLKERTELTHSRIGAPQRDSILAAGLALQQAGVIPASVDVKAVLADLIDDRVPLPSN